MLRPMYNLDTWSKRIFDGILRLIYDVNLLAETADNRTIWSWLEIEIKKTFEDESSENRHLSLFVPYISTKIEKRPSNLQRLEDLKNVENAGKCCQKSQFCFLCRVTTLNRLSLSFVENESDIESSITSLCDWIRFLLENPYWLQNHPGCIQWDPLFGRSLKTRILRRLKRASHFITSFCHQI